MRLMLGVALLLPVLLALLLVLYSQWGVRQIEAALPPQGQFIEVGGIRLHYREAGTGPTLILLHGASSNLRDFSSSVMAPLATRYRVLAFDRPGYGYSERPDGDWPNPAEIARLVLDAAEQIGVHQPVLVGHSWAGAVVMAALVEMPERLSGGVLIGGVAGHWTGPVGVNYTIGGLPLIGPLFAHALVYPVGSRVIDDAVRPVLAPAPVPPSYVQDIGARLALRPRTFLYNVEDMNRLSAYLQPLSPRYDGITLPVLLIHGSADQLVPFWNHGERLLPVIEQAQVEMIEGAGHALHHTHTDKVVGALRGFVDAIVADNSQRDQLAGKSGNNHAGASAGVDTAQSQ